MAKLGEKTSIETRRKMSLAVTGNKNHNYGKPTWNKGIKGVFFHSEETKRKMSESGTGLSHGKGRIAWNKGKSAHWMKGERNHKWISDRTKLKRYNDVAKDRRSYAYSNWRMNVWLRDNFKCKIANDDCKGRIEVHHILGYTLYPELRYIINNGITLCHAHHPRKRAEEKRLEPVFKALVSVSKEQ